MLKKKSIKKKQKFNNILTTQKLNIIYSPTQFMKHLGLFFQAIKTPYTGILVNIIRHPIPIIIINNNKKKESIDKQLKEFRRLEEGLIEHRLLPIDTLAKT